ncbi:hypothetical protein ACWDWO_03670 [Actinopolymorpha singaporensis]
MEMAYHGGGFSERVATRGELCLCGRPALVVFAIGDAAPFGWCLFNDGGAQFGPCPFCGGPRHTCERCPDYELAPDWAAYSTHRPGTRPDNWPERLGR